MEQDDMQDNLRVLVIEDEALIALLLEDMILEMGAAVVGPFVCVAGALQAAARDDFDVALVDLNLGGERADAVAALLCARGIPFALASGGSANTDPLGQTAVLQKPFSFADIAETLQRLDEARTLSPLRDEH